MTPPVKKIVCRASFFFESIETLFQCAQGALHLGQTSVGRGCSKPVAVIKGRNARQDFAGGNVMARRALGSDDDIVADGQVSSYSDLSGEDDALSDVELPANPTCAQSSVSSPTVHE